MLEPVQDHQRLDFLQAFEQEVAKRLSSILANAHRGSDRIRYEIRAANRREISEAHTVGELLTKLSGRRQRQAGLSDTSDTGQR